MNILKERWELSLQTCTICNSITVEKELRTETLPRCEQRTFMDYTQISSASCTGLLITPGVVQLFRLAHLQSFTDEVSKQIKTVPAVQ